MAAFVTGAISSSSSAFLQRRNYNNICPRVPISGSRTHVSRVRSCAASPPASETDTATSARSEVDVARVKDFLDSLGGLGNVRLVTNNGLAVLESITPLDGLFYATVRGAEYGNVIDHERNVDLHVRVDSVAGARFEVGKSRTTPSHPTYAIRLLKKDKKTVGISLFVQWDKTPEDVSPERVAHWEGLKAKFVSEGSENTAWFA